MSLRKPAYTAAEVAAAADAIRANTAILETAYADAAAEFTLWDSTAPGFLEAQGLKRLKCPSEQQFFPSTARGAPDVNWLMANAVPAMAGFNPLSMDIECYAKKDKPEDPAPTTPTEIGYLRTFVGCFRKGNPGQKLGVYMTPVERYGGCATVGPGPVRDQRIADWTARNAIMQPLADDVDYIFPSVYGLYLMPTWVTFAQQNIAQARLLAGHKPVVGYLWPIWHRNSGREGQPINYDDWMTMLETCFPICDGIAIWMASTDRFDPAAEYWKATEDFMKRHGLMGR